MLDWLEVMEHKGQFSFSRQIICALAVMMLMTAVFLSGCSTKKEEIANADQTVTWGWEPIPEEEREAIQDDLRERAARNAAGIKENAGAGEDTESAQEGNTIEDTDSTAESPTAAAEEDTAADTTEDIAKEQDDDTVSAEKAAVSAESMRQLRLSMLQKFPTMPGTWAIYVKNLDTGESLILHNQAMVSASLIKLYIAGAYYEAVQKKEIEDQYGAQLDLMLSRSDNDATNVLIDQLGFANINAFIEGLGMNDQATVLNRHMLEQSSEENYTSVKDCGEVLEMILKGTYVNENASARILADLKAQERTSKIPAGVPAGVQTANKTGELSDVENDAAIIWGRDCTYILVIMSNQVPATGAARASIVEISSLVYDMIG